MLHIRIFQHLGLPGKASSAHPGISIWATQGSSPPRFPSLYPLAISPNHTHTPSLVKPSDVVSCSPPPLCTLCLFVYQFCMHGNDGGGSNVSVEG